jgi:CheY-like chemotaxis protein
MRLKFLTADHIRQAVNLFVAEAWPDLDSSRPRFNPGILAGAQTPQEIFALFEQKPAGEGTLCARHALRLGSSRYPFMKLVVQEYLVEEEYFFSVDTHDDLDVRPSQPDFKEWMELKAANRELKERIESSWQKAGLPTHEDLRELAQDLAAVEPRKDARGRRILVVDDDSDVAHGLGALLESQGYAVELAHDGRQVLDRLDLDPLPDLVILDYAMPELNGQEVLERMRAASRTRNVPVLLATASTIDLAHMRRISGLLRKPYPAEVLFAMVARLLDS